MPSGLGRRSQLQAPPGLEAELQEAQAEGTSLHLLLLVARQTRCPQMHQEPARRHRRHQRHRAQDVFLDLRAPQLR